MIKRIIASIILICLFIAIPLALMGYKKVELGAPFLALMNNVSKDLAEFKIEIPSIPMIPKYELQEASGGLEVLINILNALINFVNMLITIVNALVTCINVVIQLLQVIFLVIKNLVTFKDSIQPVIL